MGVEAQSSSEWRRHWPVLVPSLAGIMLGSVHAYSLGAMIRPLEQEFGWSRAAITAGPLIIAFVALPLAPLVGIAIDRFGPRRIGLFGVIFFCAALALASTATSNILTWWALWALLGLASLFIMPAVWTATINGFFSKNRGKALAIALCGTSLGLMIVPTLTNILIDERGWRQAYVGLAALSLLVVMPAAFFLFRGVKDRRREDAVSAMPSASDAMLSGFSAREGLASPAFRKLTAAIIVFTIASCVLTTNGVPVLVGQGFSWAEAAGLAGLIGIGSLIGRLGGGILLDHFDAKKVTAISVLGPVITITLFLMFPGAVLPTGIACVILGLSVGTELDACAYLAARHFGMRSFGTLFGTLNGFLLFGVGIAPVASNYVYDVTRSYNLVLWGLIPMFVLASLLFLLLGRYPNFADGSSDGASLAPPTKAQAPTAG